MPSLKPARAFPTVPSRYAPGNLPCPTDAGLGANSVGEAYTVGNAVLGEIVCTFILVSTVLCRAAA